MSAWRSRSGVSATSVLLAILPAVALVMWLIMRGAVDDTVRVVHRFHHVPASNTAVGRLVLENAGG